MDLASSNLASHGLNQALLLLSENCDNLRVLLMLNHSTIAKWTHINSDGFTDLRKTLVAASRQITRVKTSLQKALVTSSIKELQNSLTRLKAAYTRLLNASLNLQDGNLGETYHAPYHSQSVEFLDDELETGWIYGVASFPGNGSDCKHLLMLAVGTIGFQLEIFIVHNKQFSPEQLELGRQEWHNIITRASAGTNIETPSKEVIFGYELLELCQSILSQTTPDRIGIFKLAVLLGEETNSPIGKISVKRRSKIYMILSRALQYAQEAAVLHNAEQFDRAIPLYTQAYIILSNVLADELKQEDREKLTAIMYACRYRIVKYELNMTLKNEKLPAMHAESKTQDVQSETSLFLPGQDTMSELANELRKLFEVNPRDPVPRSSSIILNLKLDSNLSRNISLARTSLHTRGFSVDEVVTSNSETLLSALTLTGTRNCLQAISCGKYLDQVWPLEGRSVLEFLVSLGEPYRDKPCLLNLTRVSIEGFNVGSSQAFRFRGEVEALIEVVQIIAWIYATFQISPFEGGAYFTPHIYTVPSNFVQLPRDKSLNGKVFQQTGTYDCMIDFSVKQLEPPDGHGDCWLGALYQPVIVEGYPIPRRPPDCEGLEISYDLLPQVIGAAFVSYYNNMLFIRAFSQMVYVTGEIGNILQWHYVSSGDANTLVSYHDISAFSTRNRELKNNRHILGWCSQARCIAGSPDAKYVLKAGSRYASKDSLMAASKGFVPARHTTSVHY